MKENECGWQQSAWLSSSLHFMQSSILPQKVMQTVVLAGIIVWKLSTGDLSHSDPEWQQKSVQVFAGL